MVSSLLGKILAIVLRIMFRTIPGAVIDLFKALTEFIGRFFKLTALMMRVFVMQLVVFEAIFEILPGFIGEKMYDMKLVQVIYKFFTSVQWDKSICDRIGDFLAYELGDFLSSLHPVALAALIVCSIGVIVLSVIVIALMLNAKYLAFFLILDVILLFVKLFVKGSKTFSDKKAVACETPGLIALPENIAKKYGEAGVL